MKRITAFAVLLISLLILSGCSQSSKIEKGEVESVTVEVIESNYDKEELFTLLPVTIMVSDGNGRMSPSITYIPMWQDIDYLEVVYKFKGKEYTTRTKDFKVKKSTKTYAKIAQEDIGKADSSLVIYMK